MRKLVCLLAGVICLAATSWAQNITLKGKVTDSNNGTPLEGVSITTFDGKVGVKTSADGDYSISFPATNKTLNFSYAGYTPEIRSIGKLLTLDVQMKSDEVNLKEVVVTAFGIKKDKKTLGYGVSQLNAEELTQGHTTNVTNALAGKIAGVRVSGAGGSFTGSSIIIRGNTTFTGSNQPLFVIDGVPFDNGGGAQALQNGAPSSNRAIDINQEDIESMSVLKGPSAAALYGSRASNGVILITTKKGKFKQKNSVTFTSIYGQEMVNRLPDYQNSYAQGSLGVYNPTGVLQSWGPLITGQTVNNAFGKPEVLRAYPDNVKDIFRTGENLQNNISFSGGTDRNTFRFSYGNLVNTGILDNNRLVRNNFSVNAGSRVTEKLFVSVSGNYVNNFSKRTQQGNQLSNPLFRAYFTPRTYDLTGTPFENPDGSQNYYNNSIEDNPYWTIKNNRFNDEINRFFGYAALNYKFSPAIQVDYKMGTDVFSTFNHGYDQIGARGGANTSANGVGGVVERRNEFRSLNSNGFVTFNKRFGDFSTTAIVGNEISQIYGNATTVIGRGVIIRDFEHIKNTTTIPTPGVGSSKVRLFGLYGDFTVGYKSIASLNVTLRNDWSSTFKPGKNSYLYNAVAGSLNITELFPTLKNNVIDNIKIRGNVSTVGKAGTDFFYSTDSYFSGAAPQDGFGPRIDFPFGGLQGFTLQDAAGNANLGPEFTTNKEIATELSFFRGRLNIEGTVYRSDSRDLIFAVPVSNTSGIGNVVKNAGTSYSKGVELSVIAVPLKTKLGSWTINLNYSKVRTYVESLDAGVANIFLGGFTTPNIRLVVGDQYGQIYGNAYQRDPKSGSVLIGANGLPLITTGVQKIGNPNPDYLLGITNTIEIKGFTLSFLLDIKKGGDQYSRNIADIRRNGVGIETAEFARLKADGTPATPYIFPGVLANGQPNTIPITAQNYWGNNGKYAAAEGFIVETSWFRVREASLGYRLPAALINKTPFGNIELSLFGRNLFLHAPNYPHLDPEQNALGVSNAQGLEFNALPQTRSMGVSLKLSL